MITMNAKIAATAALTVVIAASAACGQTAAPPTKLKPKPNASTGPTIAVTVTNKRKVGVSELDAAEAGFPTFKPVVRNLAPGKQTVITLPRDETCAFDFFIKYDDGDSNTISGVRVCEDGKLNIVE